MPYKLRKAPRRDLYWVIAQDGRHMSKDPLPKERAQAQMRALYAAEGKSSSEPKKGGEKVFDEGRFKSLMERRLSKEKYEAKSARLPHLKMKPYEEYVKELEDISRSRSTRDLDVERAAKKQEEEQKAKNVRYEQYIKENPGEQEVMCNLDASLEPKKDRATVAECGRRHAAYNEKKFNENPFGKIIRGLTTVGDVLTSVVPMPKIVKEGFQLGKDLTGVKGYMDGGMFARASTARRGGIKVHPAPRDLKAERHRILRTVINRVRNGESLPDVHRELRLRAREDPTYPFTEAQIAQAYDEMRDIVNAVLGRPAPADDDASTVASEAEEEPDLVGEGNNTFREQFYEAYGVKPKSYSLKQLSKISKVPLTILQQVYNRGVGAAKTQPQSIRLEHSYVKNVKAPRSSKLSKEKWAYGRVYSFLMGNPKHDNDLRANKLSGEGFFGDIWNAAKAGVKKAVASVKTAVQRVPQVISRGVRDDYAPAVRSLLAQIGDKPVVDAFVRRDPIQAPLNAALNLVTMGKWNEIRKKYNYDDLFHLGLEVVIRMSYNPEILARYVIEKNEVISITPAKGMTPRTETMRVPQIPNGLTINNMLESGRAVLGNKFFPYDAFTNNCQDFIMAILQGSGISNNDLAAFVKQPLENVLSELPSYTGTIARAATDLGGLVNTAWYGYGGVKPSPRFRKQLAQLRIDPIDYLREAQRKADEAGLVGHLVGFSNDEKHKLQVPNVNGRIVRFGATGLGDHILYTLSENPMADEHRQRYLARATKIRGKWKDDPYSPNSLAIEILW